jgi:hypothetical protein
MREGSRRVYFGEHGVLACSTHNKGLRYLKCTNASTGSNDKASPQLLDAIVGAWFRQVADVGRTICERSSTFQQKVFSRNSRNEWSKTQTGEERAFRRTECGRLKLETFF